VHHAPEAATPMKINFAPDFWKLNVNSLIMVLCWIFTMGVFYARFENRVALLERNDRVQDAHLAVAGEKLIKIDLYGSTASQNVAKATREKLVEVEARLIRTDASVQKIDSIATDVSWIIRSNAEIKEQLNKLLRDRNP
jgi:hypothetical protein